MKRSISWYAIATPIFSLLHVSSALAQGCCAMPNYESTYTVPGPYTITRFKQELLYVFNGYTLHFNGRQVMEDDGTGAVPSDTCYFSGSAIPPQTMLSGGNWLVDGYDAFQTDYWGYDYVGWSYTSQPQPVPYYRLYRPQNNLSMPCNSTVVQAMLMFCEPDVAWVEYRDRNILTRWIDMTTVTNCRTDITNSACSTQTYP